MYALTLQQNPGLVIAVSEGEATLPSQVTVESLPAGGAIGEMYYIDGEVVLEEDLTAAQRVTLGLAEAAGDDDEEEEEGGLEIYPRGEDLGGSGGNASATGQSEDNDEETAALLTGISTRGVLVSVSLPRDDWVSSGGKRVFSIASSSITSSTVLYVLGINRAALTSHIRWQSTDGLITFTTEEDVLPADDIVIRGVLSETGDDWQAEGVIEAWPGAGLVSQRYRESLCHEEGETGWPIVLTARGTENASKTIRTNVGFANAELLFATPEWTGNSGVIMPHIFVQESSHHLCYTLTNTGDSEVEISEVAIRLMYSGVVSNLITDETDAASLDGYIDPIDIDELDE